MLLPTASGVFGRIHAREEAANLPNRPEKNRRETGSGDATE
jgi:hypothetical protein